MKCYHIKRIAIWKSEEFYCVEVYNPYRDKKHREYKKLPFSRICKLCNLIERLAEARAGNVSIAPGYLIMSVELALR